MVRFYLFLLFKSLAAVWRMDWQEGSWRVGRPAKSFYNSPCEGSGPAGAVLTGVLTRKLLGGTF